jgi:hypothetical protein
VADDKNQTTRSDTDYAIEFGRYLTTAAENFMQSHNECMTFQAGCDCDALCDRWKALESAIYEFRKRADRADVTTKLVRRLAAQQRLANHDR